MDSGSLFSASNCSTSFELQFGHRKANSAMIDFAHLTAFTVP